MLFNSVCKFTNPVGKFRSEDFWVLNDFLSIGNFLSGNCCRIMRCNRYVNCCTLHHQILLASSRILSAIFQIPSANIDRWIYVERLLKNFCQKMQYDRNKKSYSRYIWILSANSQIPSANSWIPSANTDWWMCTTIVLTYVLSISNLSSGNCCRQMRYDRYWKSFALCHRQNRKFRRQTLIGEFV